MSGKLKTEKGEKMEKATFGAGCFWGVEEKFRQTKGVVETKVGYSGGHTENPTYEQVCGKQPAALLAPEQRGCAWMATQSRRFYYVSKVLSRYHLVEEVPFQMDAAVCSRVNFDAVRLRVIQW